MGVHVAWTSPSFLLIWCWDWYSKKKGKKQQISIDKHNDEQYNKITFLGLIQIKSHIILGEWVGMRMRWMNGYSQTVDWAFWYSRAVSRSLRALPPRKPKRKKTQPTPTKIQLENEWGLLMSVLENRTTNNQTTANKTSKLPSNISEIVELLLGQDHTSWTWQSHNANIHHRETQPPPMIQE